MHDERLLSVQATKLSEIILRQFRLSTIHK
jgi:hypothetical protein